MVCQYYPPFAGGKETWVQQVSRRLVHRGHDVTVMTSNIVRNSFSPQSFDSDSGIRVCRLPVLHNFRLYYAPITLPNLSVLRERYDILHIHEPSSIGVLATLVAQRRGLPIFATVYNDPSPFYTYYRGGLNKFFSLGVIVYNHTFFEFKLKHAKKIFALSEMQMESSPFLRRYRQKVQVVGMGVDPSLFFPGHRNPDTDNYVLFVGRIDPRKGFEYLLKALECIPHVRLVVIGSGPEIEVERVKRLAEPLGDRVKFLGSIPHRDLLHHYQRAALVCLPSIHPMETFGGVLLEAMACARPVITTTVVGFSDILEREKAGFVVTPKSSAPLVVAIEKLLTNRELSEEMGRNGARLAERYSYDRITQTIESAYRSAI